MSFAISKNTSFDGSFRMSFFICLLLSFKRKTRFLLDYYFRELSSSLPSFLPIFPFLSLSLLPSLPPTSSFTPSYRICGKRSVPWAVEAPCCSWRRASLGSPRSWDASPAARRKPSWCDPWMGYAEWGGGERRRIRWWAVKCGSNVV